MADALYQLEAAEGGEVFICLGGERMAVLPASVAGDYTEAVERIEDDRGRQIALRWLLLGIAAADPSSVAMTREGASA